MAVLSVSNIKKAFGSNVVLTDISFDVEEGEVVAIIGPSGSGKSTILRCINQLETIDGGQITLLDDNMIAGTSPDGKPIYSSPQVLRKMRLNIGLVFQNFNLFPHFSVMRNVTEAPIHVLKMPKEQAVEEAKDLLAKMGLSDKHDAYPYQLSGGQQQRVSIARALALHPEVLFFDEPTSAFDPELTGEILKVIRGLAREKHTMVIVTHEMAFARDVADRVIFMDQGVIVEQGDPRQVINHPREERTKLFLKRYSEDSQD